MSAYIPAQFTRPHTAVTHLGTNRARSKTVVTRKIKHETFLQMHVERKLKTGGSYV